MIKNNIATDNILIKNTMFRIIGILLLLFACSLVLVNGQTKKDTTIFSAMQDELDRSMHELVYKDTVKPFYIAYSLFDIQSEFCYASLGAVVNSFNRDFKTWYLRVMVGDYILNDENFQDYNASKSPYDGNIDLPIDNDYFGIRRSLWMTTNNVFKSATETYTKKLTALEQKNLKKEDLEVADFSVIPVINKEFPNNKTIVDRDSLEAISRRLSGIFNEYPDIIHSNVSACDLFANDYFINSEGIRTKSPVNIASIMVEAYGITKEGMSINNHLAYNTTEFHQLPSEEKIAADLRLMAENLKSLGNAAPFDENYTGPVLFVDQAAAELLAYTLFSGAEKLIANREPLMNAPQSMYYGQNSNTLDTKIGKKVTSEKLNVTVYSEYPGEKSIPALGAFYLDGESTEPKDSLVLVKNGLLQTLLNGRTPTKTVPASNGYDRNVLYGGSVTRQTGPGIVEVNSTDNFSYEELKSKLIETTKNNGYDYGIIIRPLISGSNYSPLNFYKVYVSDGHEELIRSETPQDLTINSLKKIIGTSGRPFFYNMMLPVGSYGDQSPFGDSDGQEMATGIPTTFIVPDAILLDEIEFNKTNIPISTNLPIVDNPLKKAE